MVMLLLIIPNNNTKTTATTTSNNNFQNLYIGNRKEIEIESPMFLQIHDPFCIVFQIVSAFIEKKRKILIK